MQTSSSSTRRGAVAVILALACLALPFFSLTACSKPGESGAAKRPRFAFVTNCVVPFWTIAKVGAQKAGAELGVDVLVEMPTSGIANQKQILEDLITRGVDGIAVSPIDHVNQTSLLDELASKTHLITHDSDAPKSKRVAFVGMDNYDAGRMAGKLIKEALPQGGKIMLFVGRLEQDNGRLRRQGILDEVLGRSHDPSRFDAPEAAPEQGNYKILGTSLDQSDMATAKANAADALTADPDIHAMVGLFAHNTPAIVEALRQAGKLGAVKVVGFDEEDATLQGIVDGHVFGTVVQDPYNYGYRSMQVLMALHKGDKSVVPANQRVEVSARVIRRGEVEAFWSDLKQKTGKK